MLEMRGITKRFASNAVLEGVDLCVAPGEVHALVGENGAGKSTLMKILAGVYKPDAGEILIGGSRVNLANPADAIASGIAMIYQELSLAPHLTVAQNIFLGREPLRFRPLKILDTKALNARASTLLAQYGFRLDPSGVVGRLSSASRQLVEITRATVEARRLIVMDEPTSSLTTREVSELFRLIGQFKSQGLGVIYISHRLEELEQIADSLTVLRDGRVVYTGRWGDLSTEQIIHHMVGRKLTEIFPTRNTERGATKLQVEHLTMRGKFDDVTFEARAGEIVGIAGLAGAGRTDLIETIFGARSADSGAVRIDGEPVQPARPDRAIEGGLGLLTEDRKQTALFLNLSVARNLTVANMRAIARRWLISRKRESTVARGLIEKLRVRPADPAKAINRLSGGNQQKVVLGRWLFAQSRVLLLDEPTRGVDIQARAEIYRVINGLVEAGAAVVLVSSDLPELFGMADRILVMRRGRLVAEVDPENATQEQVVAYATLEERHQPLDQLMQSAGQNIAAE
jgi:ribose transport system ATP-binding protein